MRTPRRTSNLAAALAAGGLILAPVVQARAQAQADGSTADATASATPDQTQGIQTQGTDLPNRVGRLAKLSGTVSFHTADEDHWDAATLNYPVTSGDAFWTEPNATASLEIADSQIDMSSTTEFDIDQLDDHALTATQAQGETFLNLRDLQPNESYMIRTPRGTVTIAAAGQYEIAAGDTQSPTTITVVDGAAQISGDNLSLSVQAGQTATITGSGAAGDGFAGSVAPTGDRDPFLTAELAACTPVAPQASATATATAHASASVTATAPAVVRQMPGGEQLSSYGSWQQSPQYGQVWYPQVARDWVPYRDGHWAYVAPWGWTWIDDEAWGYAPFHYGRWVQVDNRWGWAPVYYGPGFAVPTYYAPVYAPALVSFFGFGAGLAAGLAIGGGVGFGFGLGFGGFGWGHIGWCPLGWGEPFRPWFGGARYFTRVNQYNVVNIHNITYNNSVHNVTINNFANAARGATVVPTAAMLNSRRAGSVAQPFSRQNFAEAHPVSTVPRPTAHTAGVTPRLAHRLGLPDAAQAGAGRTAPGPRVQQATTHGAVALRQAAPRAGTAGTQARGATAEPPRTAAARGGMANPTMAARTNGAPGHAATREEAAGRPAAGHGGLPPLRTAGAMSRAVGGAPGPAFTPHAGLHAANAPTSGGAAGGRTSFAANQAQRGAPGPAIAPRGAGVGQGATPARAAQGRAPSMSRAGLPALRPAEQAGTRAAAPAARGFSSSQPAGAARFAPRAASPAEPQRGTPAPRSYQPARPQTPQTHYQAPQHAPAAQPRYQAPAYHAPAPAYHAPAYHSPAYQAPAYHAPAYQAPRYQAPAYRAPTYQAPRYQAPRYQAPAYRAPAYQAPRYQAPRSAPGGGRRPWQP